MIYTHNIDPVALSIPLWGDNAFSVHWYGLTYLIAFAFGWLAISWRQKRRPAPWSMEAWGDLFTWVAICMILGGRIGYQFFYDLDRFIENPAVFFAIWQGGMSFHGGFLGVIAAFFIFAKKHQVSFWDVADRCALLAGFGTASVRVGNFINGELFGRVTDVPWAVVFPAGGSWGRHPSQLYEAFLEGIVILVVVWWFAQKARPKAAVAALFCILYGTFRFLIEFVRQPDSHIGFIAWDWLTKGQLLTLPIFIFGVGLMWFAYKRHEKYLI